MNAPIHKPVLAVNLICVMCSMHLYPEWFRNFGFIHRHGTQPPNRKQCPLAGHKYVVGDDAVVREYFDHDF